jgi:hypothetical protein
MKQQVLVLSVNRYKFTDDKGELNAGCTVRYVFSQDLAVSEIAEKEIKGHRPAKATLSFEDYAKFPAVPALYEVTLESAVDSQGKASLSAVDFVPVANIVVSKAKSPPLT